MTIGAISTGEELNFIGAPSLDASANVAEVAKGLTIAHLTNGQPLSDLRPYIRTGPQYLR
jgi:hypothetical protein